MPHEEARAHRAQDQQQGKVIGEKGDVTQLRNDYPAEEQKRQSREYGDIAQIQGRDADLKEPVHCGDAADPGGDRLDEKTQVPEYDDQ